MGRKIGLMGTLGLLSVCLTVSACTPARTASSNITLPGQAAAIVPDHIVPLWQGAAPGSPEILPKEEIVFRANAFGLVDRAAHNVAIPSVSVFKASNPNGGAILIIPGGGYSWVVIDKEGYESASFFTRRGYDVYVLRYRLPHQNWQSGPDTPLQDAQRAIRYIRSLNPTQKVMVMGFSAGGHVAGTLAAKYDQAVSTTPRDELSQLSARPDVSVLMYPVVTMTRPFAHAKSRENMIGAMPTDGDIARYSLETSPNPNTPPTFILHASDDEAVKIENATMLFETLRRAKVPVAFHAFEKGGHGFGMRGISGTPLQAWPDMVLAWATSHGFPAPN